MHVFDLSITYHQKIMTCPDTMLAATYYVLNIALNHKLCLMFYKILNNLAPEYLSDLFYVNKPFIKISDQIMTIQLLILNITLKKLFLIRCVLFGIHCR